jgi:hypothetical protein
MPSGAWTSERRPPPLWALVLACLSASLGCSPGAVAPAGADAATDLDACKPRASAPTEVIVGQGQTSYLPLMDLEAVQVERGPQGGNHIWVALRMKNLFRSGSRTVIAAMSPDKGVAVAPLDIIFTFDPGEGGYCELFGLRYQLDARGVDVQPLLGKELDLTATVTDRAGDSGQGFRRVTLSPTIL